MRVCLINRFKSREGMIVFIDVSPSDAWLSTRINLPRTTSGTGSNVADDQCVLPCADMDNSCFS
ncbi:ABC-type transporter Mla maintaining outer membrane lipid asymmetry [Pseudomonas syringae pv. actinidiae]|uniref:ABC-type transporter Mla maintaining outer membrane lipid asymmetry n=1 Tax=Pseudomonas syringae pv. actinidiae TaxID=103796 RepID=A0AAN4Q843_PSESF|nr:ABC-type transporter Mla maintaining outer membrane lipid asymmetry [Pseudomonas syringae pv. actinidiae]